MERYSQRAADAVEEVPHDNFSNNQQSPENELTRPSFTNIQPQQLQCHDQTKVIHASIHQGTSLSHPTHANKYGCNSTSTQQEIEGRDRNAAYQSPSPLNAQYDHETDTGPAQSSSDDGRSQPLSHDLSRSVEEENQGGTKEEKDDYHYDDEEIQKDAADEMVAIMVHIALGFFVVLFFGALVAAIIIVGKYGLLTFIIVSTLMMTALTIGYFVSRMLDQDKVLKPVRRKIRRWHAVATAVVVQEMRDFQLDMNEHLLLTNGSAHNDEDSVYNVMDENGNVAGSVTPGMNTKRRKTRSKVFGMLVKPFLKKKKGFRFGRKKKKTETNDMPVDGDHEMV